MASNIRLNFLTSEGSNRAVNIRHANAAVGDNVVRAVMQNMLNSTVINGAVARRSAFLITTTTQEFDVA